MPARERRPGQAWRDMGGRAGRVSAPLSGKRSPQAQYTHYCAWVEGFSFWVFAATTFQLKPRNTAVIPKLDLMSSWMENCWNSESSVWKFKLDPHRLQCKLTSMLERSSLYARLSPSTKNGDVHTLPPTELAAWWT